MKKLNLLLLLCLISSPAFSDPNQIDLLSAENWRPLKDVADGDLQLKLENALNNRPRWKTLIKQKRLAVGVVDMRRQIPRSASINGNEMMYAASLPKIAILLSAYVSFEDGTLAETPAIHKDLSDMIRVSSNAAATRVIDAIGLRKIATVLEDPTYGFYDETKGGGLWVGKRYAATGRRFGDPIHNISHGATVTQVCRFYYLLAHGQLINGERSREMLEDLSDPGLHHKFVSQLDRVAPTAQVFRKSGTWKNWHSDSVMVWGREWRKYILVAMIEDPDGEEVIKQLLPLVESILYQKPLTQLSLQ